MEGLFFRESCEALEAWLMEARPNLEITVSVNLMNTKYFLTLK